MRVSDTDASPNPDLESRPPRGAPHLDVALIQQGKLFGTQLLWRRPLATNLPHHRDLYPRPEIAGKPLPRNQDDEPSPRQLPDSGSVSTTAVERQFGHDDAVSF